MLMQQRHVVGEVVVLLEEVDSRSCRRAPTPIFLARLDELRVDLVLLSCRASAPR